MFTLVWLVSAITLRLVWAVPPVWRSPSCEQEPIDIKQTNKQKNKQKMMLTRRAKLWEGGMQTSILIFAAFFFFFLKELIVVYEPFDGNVVFMGS